MGKRPELVEKTGPATLNEELPADAAVVVPLFGSERSPETLVEMGASLAHGRRLEVLHVTAVPEQIFLADALEDDSQSQALSRRIHAMAEEENVVLEYDKTVSRDVVDTIYQVAGRLDCEWVVMEAAGRRRFGISFQNPLGWLQDHLPCNLAVFKDAGVRYIRQILVFVEPGPHDSLVVATADHLAQIYKAELNFICFVDDTKDLHSNQARGDYIDQLRDLCVSPTQAIALHGTSEQQTTLQASGGFDLMIMGAAPNRTLRGRLFGTPTDELTRQAQCSVLWLKTQAIPTLQTFDVEHMAVDSSFDLCEYLSSDCVKANLDTTKKENLFQVATDLIVARDPKSSKLVVSSALWEREQLQNTYVGDGVAMPHATLVGAKESMVAVLTSSAPIVYGDNDEAANVFFFTTGSPNDRQIHLQILAELSRLSIHTDFLEKAKAAKSDAELYQLLVDRLKK
jgi:mannitol/fructose-specific phosphotransferase system IIA component (Ntr-type)/nucleotide-binding universal stress UspA family protein